jgi:hypothetical protein
MNLGGGLRAFGAAMDRPRTDFLFAGREIADQIQQTVTGTDELAESGLVDPQLFQELFARFLRQSGSARRAFR